MDVFKRLELVRQQNEKEAATRYTMLNILELGDVEEGEIPQNSNLGSVIRVLMGNERTVYSAIQKLDLDYLVIEEYMCFKVDDETTGIENIYFISSTSTKILYLESGCLI